MDSRQSLEYTTLLHWVVLIHLKTCFPYCFLWFKSFNTSPRQNDFWKIFSSFKCLYFLKQTPPRSCLVLSYSYFKFKANLVCGKRVKHHSSVPLIMMMLLLLKQDVRGCWWARFFSLPPLLSNRTLQDASC